MCFFTSFQGTSMKLFQEYYQDTENQIWVKPHNFTPKCIFYRAGGSCHRAKKNSRISLSYSSLERSCSTDKTLQENHTFIFCFLKVIEIYKLLKSGGSPSFSAKEKTKIKCICYINNMFSKIFINQAFNSYTYFDFRCTYKRYRFKMIKTCGSIYPLKITKSYLKPLQHSYFNIKE